MKIYLNKIYHLKLLKIQKTKIFWAQTYSEKQWKKQQQSIKDSSNSKQRFDEFENNEDNPLGDDYGYFKIHRYRSTVYDRDYNMKGKINKIYYSNNQSISSLGKENIDAYSWNKNSILQNQK